MGTHRPEACGTVQLEMKARGSEVRLPSRSVSWLRLSSPHTPERETERETERDRERQGGRETERDRERGMERETEREGDREGYREGGRERQGEHNRESARENKRENEQERGRSQTLKQERGEQPFPYSCINLCTPSQCTGSLAQTGGVSAVYHRALQCGCPPRSPAG
jgi:hypothetical protein